jgi:hypothetical protein
MSVNALQPWRWGSSSTVSKGFSAFMTVTRLKVPTYCQQDIVFTTVRPLSRHNWMTLHYPPNTAIAGSAQQSQQTD